MKTIFSATAGAVLGSALIILALAMMNGSESLMLRELVFSLSCNALFCGLCWWPLAKIKSTDNLHFDALAGACLAFAGWFALPLALLKRKSVPHAGKRLLLFGKLSYALPALAFFLLPQIRIAPQMLESPALKLSAVEATPDQDAPNVLLVVVDTLRADVVLDPEVPTPNLDALREDGTWADYAVAPCNQTLPSHLVLLTGFDIEKVGMRGNLSRWPSRSMLADNKCLPIAERYQLAGYNTAAVSTNMLLSSVDEDAGHQAFSDGFDTWHGIHYQTPFVDFLSVIRRHTLMGQILPTRFITFPLNRILFPNDIKHFLPHYKEGERTTNSAIDYLQDLQQDDRPYFMLAQYFDPHSPYIAPNPARGSIARPDQRPAGYSAAPEDEYFMRVNLRNYCDNESRPDDFLPLSDYLHALYKEEVVYLDQQLGRLLEQSKLGSRETIIVFVSDHGEGFGLYGGVEHGSSLYNEEILVPFIISGPGVAKSNRLSYAPEMIDAVYTMLELSNITTVNVDGQSVVDDAYQTRPAISFKIDHVSVIDGDYKFYASLTYPDDSKPYELIPLTLYDLATDFDERNNIIDASPEVVSAMRAIIATRMANDLFPHITERELSGKQLQQLGELGYTD